MVKLSIIIPFYNTYELTYKLLKVLEFQKTDEIEIIILDDSNDSRLDEFKNIAIIDHHDGRTNLSKARNKGIDIAKGNYIAFIDSDDMVTWDYVETLIKAIKENPTDIILFNWADFNENEIIRHPENYAVWKAIYKKEILPRFNENIKYNEDVEFQEEIKKHNYSKSYIDRVLYIYNSNRIGSLMWEKLNDNSRSN